MKSKKFRSELKAHYQQHLIFSRNLAIENYLRRHYKLSFLVENKLQNPALTLIELNECGRPVGFQVRLLCEMKFSKGLWTKSSVRTE